MGDRMYFGTKWARHFNLEAINKGDFESKICLLIFYNLYMVLFVCSVIKPRTTLEHMVVEYICVHVELSSTEKNNV